MFYRENGQFKTSYRADQQIFPITQDRLAILAIVAIAALVVPFLVDEYLFRAILIPFLILSLAALGVNILVGYCGQISLGSGAFMAVGAYMAYNTYIRVEGMPLIVALLSGGFFATLVGLVFGIPSLRVKGLYLAVATLAAQFFCDWAFLRVGWFTNNNPSGSVSVSNLNVMGWGIETPLEKYLFCLGFLVVFGVLAKNLVRSAIGREWMAIRDMDVAAAVIGIRPMYAKLSAFAVSSFIVGVAGALWAFVHLGSWEPAAFSIDRAVNSDLQCNVDGYVFGDETLALRTPDAETVVIGTTEPDPILPLRISFVEMVPRTTNGPATATAETSTKAIRATNRKNETLVVSDGSPLALNARTV